MAARLGRDASPAAKYDADIVTSAPARPEARPGDPALAVDPAPGRGGVGRWLPGMWFPVVVFAVWRLVHLVMLQLQGGPLIETAYRYDGAHYLRILHHGYWSPRPALPSHAFFPGLSWLATPFYWLTGSDAAVVVVVTTGTGLAAFVAVWGVARAWRDEAVARRAVVLLALFPSSAFLWAFYSEAAFIALGAGAVWADRRGRRWVAAACLAGVATTRSIGILVAVALVVVAVGRDRRVTGRDAGYLAAGAAGLGVVVAMMWWQVGDPLAWLGVQGDWGRDLGWPWESVVQGFANLDPEAGTVMVPALLGRELDLWGLVLAAVPLGYAALSRRDRFPAEAWVLGLALIVVQLSSSVLASFNRFVLADWVIYPVAGSMAGRVPPPVRRLGLVVLVLVSVWVQYRVVGLLARNRFVG